MSILKLDYQGLPAHADREAEKQADSNTGKSRITQSRFIKAKRHGMSEVGFSHFAKTKKGGDLSRQGTLGRPPTKAV